MSRARSRVAGIRLRRTSRGFEFCRKLDWREIDQLEQLIARAKRTRHAESR
jgi:hypothetical protein